MSAITRENTGTDHQAVINRERLVEFLDAVEALVNEAKLHVSNDGWKIAAVDPANVACVTATLNADAFDSFDLPGSDIEIGVGVKNLRDVLDELPHAEEIHLGINRAERVVELASGRYAYSLDYIDPAVVREWPDIDGDYETIEVVVRSDRLATAIGYCDWVSDSLSLTYGEADRELWVGSEGGEESASAYLDIRRDPASDGADSIYSMDYSRDIAAALPAGREVTVEFGDETPYHFRYGLDGGGEVEFIQAPRIRNEDE